MYKKRQQPSKINGLEPLCFYLGVEDGSITTIIYFVNIIITELLTIKTRFFNTFPKRRKDLSKFHPTDVELTTCQIMIQIRPPLLSFITFPIAS